MNKVSVMLLAVTLAITLTVGVTVIGAVTDPGLQQNVEEFGEWCDDRDGQIVNVQAIEHGGLHCELPNGTNVHMSEVDTEAEVS